MIAGQGEASTLLVFNYVLVLEFCALPCLFLLLRRRLGLFIYINFFNLPLLPWRRGSVLLPGT